MKLKNLLKSSNTLVKEIHEEFDNAQDNLLKEAKRILQETPIQLVNKAERLKKLGFINTEETLQGDKINNLISINKEKAELIEYYKQTYPFQKFITVEELDRICEKYELIHAPVANYIKEVPEKNLKEIENRNSLKSSDIANSVIIFSHTGEGIKGLSWEELKKVRKGIAISQKLSDYNSTQFILNSYFNRENIQSTYFTSGSKQERVKRNGLFIAAPKSHFKLDDLKNKSKFGYFNVEILEPKDPIVFEYCKGNMVRIISKWGAEGKDELLTNPIEN